MGFILFEKKNMLSEVKKRKRQDQDQDQDQNQDQDSDSLQESKTFLSI